MASSNCCDIEGKKVFAQQGREVGVVVGLDVDLDEFKVRSFELKLRRESLEDLNMKVPLMGTQTMHLDVQHISAIGDTILLSISIDQLAVIGNES